MLYKRSDSMVRNMYINYSLILLTNVKMMETEK